MISNIIDISTLGRVARESVCVYGLINGQKIIAQKVCESPLKLKDAYNLMLRPVGVNELSVELLDLIIGIDDNASPEIEFNSAAIMYQYKPDEKLLDGYAKHVATKSR